MLTKSRLVQLLLMMFVLLVLFFWKTFNNEQNNIQANEGDASEEMGILRCNYDDACEFVSESGIYSLAIKNLPVKAEEWIDFELNTPTKNVEISKAQIAGKTMFMGRIPVKFTKSADKQFSAKSLVGSCTTKHMIWELQITVLNGEFSELLSFDFVVKK